MSRDFICGRMEEMMFFISFFRNSFGIFFEVSRSLISIRNCFFVIWEFVIRNTEGTFFIVDFMYCVVRLSWV